MSLPSSDHPPAAGASARRIAIILCAVLEDEVRALAHHLPQLVAIHTLEQGLHNTPPLLRQRLQQAVDTLESTLHPDAIALAYGLCSRGTEEVTTRSAQLIIPRAHDCITLLLGSKERYAQYARENPGTYWYSPGWNRHHVPPGEDRYNESYAEYRKKFSEDDAQFLMETEQAWFSQYSRATYVDLGLTAETPDGSPGLGGSPALAGTSAPRTLAEDLAYTQKCAAWLKWSFDRQLGDPKLLRDLLQGPWDDDRFLVLNPGESLKMTADDRIIERTRLTLRGLPLSTPEPAGTQGATP